MWRSGEVENGGVLVLECPRRQQQRVEPESRIHIYAAAIATNLGFTVFPDGREDQDHDADQIAVAFDDVSVARKSLRHRSTLQAGKNVLPKFAWAHGGVSTREKVHDF